MRRETAIKFDPRSAAEASSVGSTPAWPAKGIRRAIGWIAQAWRTRREGPALAALDDRQLADIGLCREDVERTLPRHLPGVTWKLW